MQADAAKGRAWVAGVVVEVIPPEAAAAEPVFQLDRYQSGIDHSLIDLESGMVNWYLRIPLSSLILLSSDGAVFSRDPCIGLLQCSEKRKNMAGNGRKQPEKVGYGKKRDGI